MCPLIVSEISRLNHSAYCRRTKELRTKPSLRLISATDQTGRDREGLNLLQGCITKVDGVFVLI